MTKAYLSLGSNIGDSWDNINSAIELIKERDIFISAVSPFYITEPWGKTDQNNFLNCVVEIETKNSPWQLLEIFQRIEMQLGKSIKERWGERTIDIDIIFYGQKVIYEKKLIIPHPRYHKRNFVLIPLCDISTQVYDSLKKSYTGELLNNIEDSRKVKLFDEN